MTDKIIGHSGHFVDHGDGTVTDTRSGLMWMRPAVGQKWDGSNCTGSASRFTFTPEAIAVRRDFAGYSDWRLPTIVELKNLIDSETVSLTRAEPIPWLPENEVFQGQSRKEFWSSTTVVSPGSDRHGWTWSVAERDGTPDISHPEKELLCVRLVRPQYVAHSHGQRFLLHINISGSGDGGVSAYPSAESYPSGTTVTLIAKYRSGTEFKGWVGDGVGLGSTYVVTMDSEKSISAEFERLNFFELIVVSTGSGSGGITQSPNDFKYLQGSLVKLAARPAKGSKFVRWHGDVNALGADCTVTMDSSKSVSAEFSEIEAFALVVTTIGDGRGRITRSPNAENYLHGTEVTLSATALAGSVFKRWHGDASSEAATISITMGSAKSISAEFEQLKFFELTVASTGSGSGGITQSPNDFKHLQGSLVKLAARTAKGSKFVRWHGDVNSAGASCTVTMDSAKSVVAEFAEIEMFILDITTTGVGRGQITRNPNAEKYNQGTEITLTASALDGSRFKEWHGDTSGKAATISITMDSAKSISAEFAELEAYALNVNFSGTGHGVVNRSSDSETHYRGTSIVLTAQAENGSTFSGWHGDASGVDDSCILKMTSAKTVTAQFEKVCVDDLGIAVEFESAKPATMEDGDAVIIFYLNIHNKGEKQVRVTLPLATYISRIGEEIEQDNWLSGLVIGAKGSTIRAGAFRKTGLVFIKSRLEPMSKGECLFVTVEQTKPPVAMNFTFRCKDTGSSEFELIKATAVDKHAAEGDAENLSAMALIVQRLELLESGLTEALRKLDALQDGRLLPLGDAVVRLAPAQTLPDVLRWLSTQISISVAELRTKLLPLDLLPSAVIDDINERALDLTGVVGLEDDGTTVAVQQEVLLEVIAQWQGS